jgi:hypothetical protein
LLKACVNNVHALGYMRIAETYHHYYGGKENPADIPELVGSDAHHLLNAVNKLLRSEYPRYGNSLEEADPQ